MTGGTTPTISVNQVNGGPVPFRRLSRIGGDFIGWQGNSQGIFYSLGRSFFSYDLARADSLAADSAAKAPPRPAGAGNGGGGAAGGGASMAANKPVYEASRVDVTITTPKDRPTGTVVLRGARIITMKGDEVIAERRRGRHRQPHRRRRRDGERDGAVGGAGDRRGRQDDHAGPRRRARPHVAAVGGALAAAVHVHGEPRLRCDDDARSADVHRPT